MIEIVLAGTLPAIISGIAVFYSSKAEKNSRPVSNGFAAHVTGSLDRIERRIDEHLKDHK
jgi:hypothetical protein